jgi:hypothetical protein
MGGGCRIRVRERRGCGRFRRRMIVYGREGVILCVVKEKGEGGRGEVERVEKDAEI